MQGRSALSIGVFSQSVTLLDPPWHCLGCHSRLMARTAAAVFDGCQARAACCRCRGATTQREAPEAMAAALERAEQRCAVLHVGGNDGVPAAFVKSRSVRGRQKMPSRRRARDVLTELCMSIALSVQQASYHTCVDKGNAHAASSEHTKTRIRCWLQISATAGGPAVTMPAPFLHQHSRCKQG